MIYQIHYIDKLYTGLLNDNPELNPNLRRILLKRFDLSRLIEFYQPQGKYTKKSYKYLAKELNCSLSTFYNLLKCFENNNLIKRTSNGFTLISTEKILNNLKFKKFYNEHNLKKYHSFIRLNKSHMKLKNKSDMLLLNWLIQSYIRFQFAEKHTNNICRHENAISARMESKYTISLDKITNQTSSIIGLTKKQISNRLDYLESIGLIYIHKGSKRIIEENIKPDEYRFSDYYFNPNVTYDYKSHQVYKYTCNSYSFDRVNWKKLKQKKKVKRFSFTDHGLGLKRKKKSYNWNEKINNFFKENRTQLYMDSLVSPYYEFRKIPTSHYNSIVNRIIKKGYSSKYFNDDLKYYIDIKTCYNEWKSYSYNKFFWSNEKVDQKKINNFYNNEFVNPEDEYKLIDNSDNDEPKVIYLGRSNLQSEDKNYEIKIEGFGGFDLSDFEIEDFNLSKDEISELMDEFNKIKCE